MKRTFTILMMALVSCTSLFAMSYERAREEALYLTDKMAYELNLNDQQYDDAYEINLDYFMSMNSKADLYGRYLDYRLTDLRCILHDWQYTLLMATNYFVRPLIWRGGGWFFPIYTHYTRGHFYFHRPGGFLSYVGGHGHSHFRGGFYANRRPEWNGGMRGDMRGERPMAGSQIHRVNGNGYSFNLPMRGGRNDSPKGSMLNNNRPNSNRNTGMGSSRPNSGSNEGMSNGRIGYSRNEGMSSGRTNSSRNEGMSNGRTNSSRNEGMSSRPNSSSSRNEGMSVGRTSPSRNEGMSSARTSSPRGASVSSRGDSFRSSSTRSNSSSRQGGSVRNSNGGVRGR